MRPNPSQTRPSIEQLLDAEVEALDGVMAELRAGTRNQRHYDELEARADTIACGIRAAFRTGRR